MKNLFAHSKATPILYVCMLATVFSCTQKSGNQEAQATATLINCWTNSYEENAADAVDIEVYRPCNFKEFPPSRFRMKFDLQKNNVCEYSVLAPNDAHKTSTGTWEYQTNSATLLIKDENDTVVHKFKVMEAQADKLLLKVLNP